MYAQKEKPAENKSSAVANSVAQKKTSVNKSISFEDNRPEAVSQRTTEMLARKHATEPRQSIQRKGSSRQNYVQRVIQRNGKDVIESTILDQNTEAVKADVDFAMSKIKFAVIKLSVESVEVANALKNSGRDWIVYAPLISWFYGIGGLIIKWNNTWPLEDTAGLLIDLGIALRKISTQGQQAQFLMNAYMKASRQSNKKIDKTSEWATDLPEHTAMQAGVSASTANLLKMIRMLDVNTPREIEAIMNGVIIYWKNSNIKQALGQYHTAAEVWAAYTYHLEEYVMKTPDSGTPRAKL
ncbi:hypothetical protein ACRN9G_01655 [Shewanella frigidimarina]|uniref:hypothetical protein n=1 Tax=Shewanella frigidimarina TaxID=56812 RepID=UPI003D7BFA5E